MTVRLRPGKRDKGMKAKKSGRLLRVLCLVLSMVLVAGMLSGCTLRSVGMVAAAARSFNEYKEMFASQKLPGLEALSESAGVNAELGISVKSFPLVKELEGFGLALNVESNGEAEKLGLGITPLYDGKALVSPALFLSGSELCLNIPELTGDNSYKFDLKNLGEFLCNEGLAAYELRTLGFNPFEVIRLMQQSGAVDANAMEAYKALCAEHLEEIGVEGPVRGELSVNKNALACQIYTIVIPQTVVEEQLSALCEMALARNQSIDYKELFLALGLSEQIAEMLLDEMAYEMPAPEEYSQAAQQLAQMLGEVKVDVAVSDGYIVGLATDFEVEGEKLSLRVELGGGRNYTEDVTVRLLDDYGTEIALVINSQRDGSDYESVAKLNMALEGEEITLGTLTSGRDGDDWGLSVNVNDGYDEYHFELKGELDDDNGELRFEDGVLTFDVDGYNVARGSLELRVSPYEDTLSIDTASATELSVMSLEEIENELMGLAFNAESWLMNLEEILGDKLYQLM